MMTLGFKGLNFSLRVHCRLQHGSLTTQHRPDSRLVGNLSAL